MANQPKSRWALGLGLLAGTALGYYLNTQEGRTTRRKVGNQLNEYGRQLNEYGQNIGETAKTQTSKLNASLQDSLERGKHWVEEVSSTVKDKVSSFASTTEDKLENTEDSFQRGLNRAKRNIDEKKEKIEDVIDNGHV